MYDNTPLSVMAATLNRSEKSVKTALSKLRSGGTTVLTDAQQHNALLLQEAFDLPAWLSEMIVADVPDDYVVDVAYTCKSVRCSITGVLLSDDTHKPNGAVYEPKSRTYISRMADKVKGMYSTEVFIKFCQTVADYHNKTVA